MNAIEELIRLKLSEKLNLEKKQVAARLFEVTTAAQTPAAGNKPNAGATNLQKKQKIADNIKALQARLQALRSGPKPKDNVAFQARIKQLQDKITAKQKEASIN